MDSLLQLDQAIFFFFNGMHTPQLDEIMSLLTGRFIWTPLYVALAFYVIKTFGFKLGMLYVLIIAAVVTATDQTCSSLIRPWAERLRPANPENPIAPLVHIVNGYRGGAYGFPSCHAANSFALAACYAFLLQRRKITIFLFGWAALNSYTRLYLGVHYPSDLLVGALIGMAFAVFFCIPAIRFVRDQRHKSLDSISRPRFYMPRWLSFSNQHPMGTGITIGDMIIAVGVLNIFVSLIYCVMW